MKDNKVTANKTPDNKNRAKNKKPNIFKRIGRKFKEVFSELKKVSWPGWKKVVKQTSVVLGVVVCFGIVITLIDLGLTQLLELITKIGQA